MGTLDHLCVDKAVLSEVRQRKKNLETVWVDYRNAYDSVPHSWILHCLNTFRVAKSISSFMTQVMVLWHTHLICGGQHLGLVNNHYSVWYFSGG